MINFKVELKLKWTKYCVCSESGNDNTNVNPNNIIFTIKNTNLYVPVVTLSAKDNQKLSTLLSKGFEGIVYLKIENKIKIQKMHIDTFSNQIFLESIYYLL